MDFLPGLPSTAGTIRYPLTSMTARALVCALSGDSAERRCALMVALADDPSLARWAQAARQFGGEAAAETGEEMAAWLAKTLPELWGPPLQAPDAADPWGCSPAAAALAWAAAGCAREFAEPFGADAAARAAWRALVDDSTAELPPETPTVTEQARRALAFGGLEAADEHFRACADRWSELAPAYEARWLADDPSWAACLPGLCRSQVRLADLEGRFDEALRDAKLIALKAFAYGAGHEINNPLANIASRAQSLLADEPHPERRRKLAAINTQAFRAHEMLADLMLFARPPALAPQAVDLVALSLEVVAHFQSQAAEQDTAFVVEGPPGPVTAWADPVQLRVALLALAQNALEAVGTCGRVTLEVALQRSAGQEYAVISLRDTGPGIPPEDLGRIFDPFYSGREAGRGLGFGLPKAWRIATGHGGRLEALSEFGQGATFRLWLPVQKPARVS
jgi:signal transduction histidine kinase